MFGFGEKKINKRDEFKEQRKMLIDHILESSKSFDKFLITLSSSLLGISFISIPRLIDNINIDFTKEYIYILLMFWVLIFISIISVLLSYYFSTINSILGVEREDLKYKKKNYNEIQNKIDKSNKYIKYLNISSLLSFIVGLLIFILFYFLILINMSENNTGNKMIENFSNSDDAPKTLSFPTVQTIPDNNDDE